VVSKAGRWEVHYDPYDVSRVWVRNHHGQGWITAGWTHQGVVGQPFADFTWRESRRIAARRGVDDTCTLSTWRLDGLDYVSDDPGTDAFRAIVVRVAMTVPEARPGGRRRLDDGRGVPHRARASRRERGNGWPTRTGVSGLPGAALGRPCGADELYPSLWSRRECSW
jgi:hypothetical protein